MTNKKIVYIAGSYRADTENGVRENIYRAGQVALKYWKAGYVVICPHMNSAFFGGACPDETWLEGGLKILSRCDGVVFMDTWGDSEGSIIEHKRAREWDLAMAFDHADNQPTGNFEEDFHYFNVE